jgi:hypothetical protein
LKHAGRICADGLRSMASQLRSAAFFPNLREGHRLARSWRAAWRLTIGWEIGIWYLDTPDAKPICEGGPKGAAESLGLAAETAAELRLLSVYRLADARERLAIDNVVDEVRIIISDRLAMDKAQR